MLKAGERINDELYRSTIHRLRRPSVNIWVYQPGFAPVMAPMNPQSAGGSTAQPRVA
jgi:hypothetical protein